MSGGCEPRSTPLGRKLAERIRRDGPIRVGAFMEACLGDPEHGYYRTRDAIGRDGDFITAPEISQVFGELLGLWSAVAWERMGSPQRVQLVELGPGRGTLMADALRAARLVPAFVDAVTVHLVETSGVLRRAQETALAAVPGVRWHASVSELPRGPSIVLANEFLDALPVAQIILHGGRWHERTIALDQDGRFVFAIGDEAVVTPPPRLVQTAREGDVFEHAQGLPPLMRELADAGRPCAILALDYGHEQSGLGDTLQGVQTHVYVSPLDAPGESDLTVAVDFTQVAEAATRAGLALDGPLPQAEFLGRLGIVERASRLMSANPARAGEVEAGVARLLAPQGMGSRIKAIGLRSPEVPVLPGF